MKIVPGYGPTPEYIDELTDELNSLNGYSKKGVKNNGTRLNKGEISNRIKTASEQCANIF